MELVLGNFLYILHIVKYVIYKNRVTYLNNESPRPSKRESTIWTTMTKIISRTAIKEK